VKRPEESSLGARYGVGSLIVGQGQEIRRPLIFRSTRHSYDALTRRWEKVAEVQPLHIRTHEAQTLQSSGRKEHTVQATAPRQAQSTFHIASHSANLEVGSDPTKLCNAAKTARSHRRARLQIRKPNAILSHEDILYGSPLQDHAQFESFNQRRHLVF
jgi:hypothetical protein